MPKNKITVRKFNFQENPKIFPVHTYKKGEIR